jgi:hypothetical protein
MNYGNKFKKLEKIYIYFTYYAFGSTLFALHVAAVKQQKLMIYLIQCNVLLQ